MTVTIRKFQESDIENKVKWINDDRNNKFLHYDLPLEVEKTKKWFKHNEHNNNRYDAVIEVNQYPVGLIGLLEINNIKQEAEYYITIGEPDYLGKGIAGQATELLLKYAFANLGLNRIYLYTETENIAAIKLYERVGFVREKCIEKDLYYNGRYIDRFLYSISKSMFYKEQNTPIHSIDVNSSNTFFIKRDDLIPYSFGGNKARKAKLFFQEIDRGTYDSVVTYGSSSSNHCRVIANMAATRKMKCIIISPEETQKDTFNKKMMQLFKAEIIACPVEKVAETIEAQLEKLRGEGYAPYFIPGGGHGNIGTQAYVDCYREIRKFEKEKDIHFDYIFHASGTGTTQAGLVCGQLINSDTREIIGISIARKLPRGRNVVSESIAKYLCEKKYCIDKCLIEENLHFIDDYVAGGYGEVDTDIEQCIKEMLLKNGVPLDTTYTGKAFYGMHSYIDKNKIKDKNILFIHTGGTPLFFDDLNIF